MYSVLKFHNDKDVTFYKGDGASEEAGQGRQVELGGRGGGEGTAGQVASGWGMLGTVWGRFTGRW